MLNKKKTQECGPLEEVGVVTQIRDHSFDVLLVNLAISKRIYCDVRRSMEIQQIIYIFKTSSSSSQKIDIDQESVKYWKGESKSELSFMWNPNEKHANRVEQKLEMFSNVNVVLTKSTDNNPLRFNVILNAYTVMLVYFSLTL